MNNCSNSKNLEFLKQEFSEVSKETQNIDLSLWPHITVVADVVDKLGDGRIQFYLLETTKADFHTMTFLLNYSKSYFHLKLLKRGLHETENVPVWSGWVKLTQRDRVVKPGGQAICKFEVDRIPDIKGELLLKNYS